jgi:hypothetical protein
VRESGGATVGDAAVRRRGSGESLDAREGVVGVRFARLVLLRSGDRDLGMRRVERVDLFPDRGCSAGVDDDLLPRRAGADVEAVRVEEGVRSVVVRRLREELFEGD